MKYFIWMLFAAGCFAQSADRYVFWFLDSSGAQQKKTEVLIKSTLEPDSNQILSVSRSLNYQENYSINSKSLGGSWFTVSPPSPDLGEIVIVSNTTPTYPILRMSLDLNVSAFYYFGHIIESFDGYSAPSKLNIQGYENDFGFGIPINDSDRIIIGKNIGDYMFNTNPAPINVFVFKLDPRFTENKTKFVVYSKLSYGGTNAMPIRKANRKIGSKENVYDLSGRSLNSAKTQSPFRSQVTLRLEGSEK